MKLSKFQKIILISILIVFSLILFSQFSENPKASGAEFELRVIKKDWRADETPEFEIIEVDEDREQPGLRQKLIATIASVFGKKPKIKAKLNNSLNKELELQEKKDFKVKTSSSVKIAVFKPKDFQPGLHKLKTDFEKNGKTYNLEQDFTWGVLAINVNKSIYLPNEHAYIQMAALRDDGHTICDANLKLEIINPNRGQTSVPVERSSKCGPDNVTDVADYFAYYQVNGPGKYEMRLTNLDNGYEITDFFEVKKSVPFEVERIGPTRIYPPAIYQMTLRIKANEDFSGEIIEQVPESFVINNQFLNSNFQTIFNNQFPNFKQLIWQVNWRADETYEIKYTFDAPDVSPKLYLLGPLSFTKNFIGLLVFNPQFQESRQWQIAADSIIIDESFEGTGYEESWSEANPSGIDEDYPIEEDSDGNLPLTSATECLKVAINATQTVTTVTRGLITNYDDGNARIYLKVNNLSWASPASGDWLMIARIVNATPAASAALIAYYDGANYEFRLRYFDGALTNDSTGLDITTNKWYRIDFSYDYTSKVAKLDIYNMAGSNLLSRNISFSGTARYSASLDLGIFAPSTNPGKDVTATLLYDLAVLDNSNSTYPIGDETDWTTIDATTYLPTSNSTYEWYRSGIGTPGSNNYTYVDDDPANDDTDYLYMDGAQSSLIDDSFGVSDPTGTLKKILGVRVWIRAKQYDATARNLRITLNTHSTTYVDLPQVRLSTNYADYYYELETNPNTGKPWTWDEIETLEVGIRALSDPDFGGKVTQVKVQVIHGSHKHRYCSHGPVAGGVTTSQIKIFARSARPPFIGNQNSYMKIRYSVNSDLSGYTDSAVATTTSTKDWTNIFTISSLTAGTTYYFDIMISGDNTNWFSTKVLHGWASYPSYITFPTEDVDYSFNYALISDTHNYPYGDIADLVDSFNPRFLISLGDLTTDNNTSLADTRLNYKHIYGGSANPLVEKLFRKYPLFTVWDDHDYYANNANKNLSNPYKKDNYEAALEYRVFPDFPSQNRLTGTVTNTSPSKLIDSNANFTADSIHALATYGGAFVRNTTTGAYTMVTVRDSTTQLSLIDNIFTSTGDGYEIINGFWYKFKFANIEIFITDLRSMRDPNLTTNGDMMDGTSDGGGTGSGHIQRNWFINAVNNSTAKWKTWGSSVTFNSTNIKPAEGETWCCYDPNDAQRNYIIDNITANDFFIISSDFHITALDDGTNSNWPEMLCSITGSATPAGTWSECSEGSVGYEYLGLVKVYSNCILLGAYRDTGGLICSLQTGVCPPIRIKGGLEIKGGLRINKK